MQFSLPPYSILQDEVGALLILLSYPITGNIALNMNKDWVFNFNALCCACHKEGDRLMFAE